MPSTLPQNASTLKDTFKLVLTQQYKELKEDFLTIGNKDYQILIIHEYTNTQRRQKFYDKITFFKKLFN